MNPPLAKIVGLHPCGQPPRTVRGPGRVRRMPPEFLSWSELKQRHRTAETARAAVRRGDYRRVLHDAYVVGGAPDDLATRVAALRHVLPDDVALSHWTALWALGLDVLPRDRDGVEQLDVTVPRSRHLQARAGIRTHCALLPDEELCDVGGLLVVSAERAFVDVARGFGLVEGVAAGDAALRAGATDLGRVEAAVARARGLRYVTVARSAVPHLEPRSESLMESRLRLGFVLAGGPRMEAQRDLYDEDGHHCGRADVFLGGVVVEYDGRDSRLDRGRFTHDRRRGNDLANLALEIRRFSADDYYKRTHRQRLRELERALALAAERRPRWFFGPDTLPKPWLRPLPTRAETRRLAA